MSDPAPRTEVHVTPEQRASILALYENGLYLQAYRMAESIGPLANWRGTDARILAGRLAANLGSIRMSSWHWIHAWRMDRSHPDALWYFGRYLLSARGPLAAWKFVESKTFPESAPKELRSHWCSQQATILGALRDFDAAEEWLHKAEAIGVEPWTCLEWAMLYSLEDRHEDAEAAARRALELRPWYRPAVQWVAHFLVQKERDAEALKLLTEATQRLESGAVWAQLAVLQMELKHYEDAAKSLDEHDRLSPLMDKHGKEWLDARRCDLACRVGNLPIAVEFAKKVKGRFYETLSQRLAGRNESGKRVELSVGYVRQHHKTCAPATLTSIAKFWSMPAEHVEIAEEIAYAGTPYHSERKWAQDHGWFSKGFTLTWEAAVTLIDQGIPFTLATTEVTSAHLQAVIGYDTSSGTLILRDPGDRHKRELAFDLARERYRSTGPRGVAMVPLAHREKLTAITLPDEGLHEKVLQYELALVNHRREEAEKIVRSMAAEHPGHFLTLYGKRALAWYDFDQPAELLATEELLKLFPGDLHLELARANLLMMLGRREERLAIFKRLAEQKDTDPACWQYYAQELAADARNDAETQYLLKKALRATPSQAPAAGRLLDSLARLRWAQRKFDEALELYHLATCAEDTDEFLAQNYFMACLSRGQTDKVLELLQRRFRRFGAKSNQPARTLHWAYMQLGRSAEAFETLDEAMRIRPNDGELLTYAADMHTFKGEFDRAEAILQEAEGISKPAARLRSLAYLATSRDERGLAREHWEQLLKIEPLAQDGHQQYALLLCEQEERPAVMEHITASCKKFPHHFGLARMHYDWLYADGPPAREKALKKLIEIHPADIWARIELGYNLSEQERLDEALQALDDAEPLDPGAPGLWYARALIHKKRKQWDDSNFALREAIRHSVDFDFAVRELIWQADNLQERREAVAFIERELLRQATYGAGILALREAAYTVMPLEEMLGALKRIQNARMDLWQAATVVTQQLTYMERSDEALTQAQQAVHRFPQQPWVWLDLADAHQLNKSPQAEIESLQRAAQLSPDLAIAIRMLAAAHERLEDFDEAKKVYAQAIRRAPLSPFTYIDQAEYLWRRNEYDEAIQQMGLAMKLDLGLDMAWSRLCNWYAMVDRYDEALKLARNWTKRRPGEARVWFRLGQALQWQSPENTNTAEKERIDSCIGAYDQALKRNPYWREILDIKAEVLGFASRYEEAKKACSPSIFKGKMPLELRGRLAWIKAQEGDHDAAKREMRAILREDHHFQWGWRQLVDWSFATYDFKELADAASDVLRVRPQNAQALADRGTARLRMEERDAGLEDLRAAQRKDPCNATAAYALFDELLNDGDLVAAETTLLSLQQNIGVFDYVKARNIQLAAKKENQNPALEIFRTMCLSPLSRPEALDMAMRAFDIAGTEWKSQAEQILKDAMKAPNWNLHLALLFAERWNPNSANDLPERIAVIDRALERIPGTFRFLDLKAELLTNGAQFDRAWQVCQEKTFAVEKFALEGRAAWVMYRSGRVDDAFARLRDILQQNPKYYWGWWQLADWHARAGRWSDVLEAAEQLVMLAPRDPTGFGYRGQAKENLGDPQAARADYVHAMDLQPSYVWAAWQLFNMYVKNQEWQRAEKILDKAKKYADKGDWALRKVDMLVYLNRKASFPQEFENLLKNSAKAPWLINQSLQFLIQVGWWSDAEEVLHRCLDLGPHICDPWVNLRVAMGDRRVGDDIQNMSSTRPERTNCIAAYAIELAYAKDPHGLRQWILTHEDDLREDTPCWAKVGGALAVIQDWKGIIEWLSDWKDHPKALPSMLLPLMKAYRILGDIEEARQVSLHCLTKLNADYGSSFHKVWLMYDSAMDSDVMAVQKYLDQSDLGGFDGYHQLIAAMVRGLWLMHTDKANGFARARQLLADTATYAPPTYHDLALTKTYQECVSHMAQMQGTFGAKLWRWWRWLFPKLPPVPRPPGT